MTKKDDTINYTDNQTGNRETSDDDDDLDSKTTEVFKNIIKSAKNVDFDKKVDMEKFKNETEKHVCRKYR